VLAPSASVFWIVRLKQMLSFAGSFIIPTSNSEGYSA
jgi:hypothetical protein